MAKRGRPPKEQDKPISEQDITQLFKRWMMSPHHFVVEALQIEKKGWKISNQQAEALEELRKLVHSKIKKGTGQKLTEEEKKYALKMGISIMSGKGTGKDWLAAAVIIWFLMCFPNVKIPCTANSGKQLKDVLWSEIKKLLQGSLVEEYIEVQTERVYFKGPGVKKADWGKRWFAVARTVNVKQSSEAQAETLQGFHEDYMMIVIDEASGLPYPVFAPLETTLTGLCNFVFMIFNPMRSRGYAIDSHMKDREDWVCLQWSAEDSDIVNKDQIARMERKYGRESNAFRVNVLGKPPTADTDTLIPFDWVMDAVDRWKSGEYLADPDDPLVFGIDVGAGGDKSIIVPRQGRRVERLFENSSPDTMQVVGWIVKNKDDMEATALAVDMIGLGQGVYDRLRELRIPRVYAVDARRTARQDDKFFRVRDEMYFNLRKRFEAGTIDIPPDEELIGELTCIKYNPLDSSGKIKVEGKKELRKRGIESPNKADALCMSFYIRDSNLRKKKIDAYEDEPEDEDTGSFMSA